MMVTDRLHCAQVVREAADKEREITYKGATDLVTDTDQLSEKTLLGVWWLMNACYVALLPNTILTSEALYLVFRH